MNLIEKQRNISWLSDRSVPLMSDVDEGLEMKTSPSISFSTGTVAPPQDLWSELEASIYRATTAAELVAIFEKLSPVLRSEQGKEAFAGKKQVLLSIISFKRGEALWTKEVAQAFGRVLESVPDA